MKFPDRRHEGACGVGFLLPALVGNVLGGTVIVAALAYAQVSEEIAEEKI